MKIKPSNCSLHILGYDSITLPSKLVVETEPVEPISPTDASEEDSSAGDAPESGAGEERTESQIKEEVRKALYSCDLPEERCALLNVSKDSGLRYIHCLPKGSSPMTVSMWFGIKYFPKLMLQIL